MANTYDLIASSTVGSGGAANIQFTSIPSTYTDLCLKVSTRTDDVDYFKFNYLRFNSSTTGYTDLRLEAQSGTPTSTQNTGLTELYWGVSTGASATSSTFANSEIYIPNYASSQNKSLLAASVSENNSGTDNRWILTLFTSRWSNTNAITSILLAPAAGNFVQYSTAYLYGIKNS